MNFIQPIVPLMREPNAGCERVDEALHGYGCQVLEDLGPWVKVRTFYQYEGYCPATALSSAPFSANAQVRAGFAPVTDAPDTCAAVLITLPRGAYVQAGEIGDGWTEVLLADGRWGWIRSRWIEPLPQTWQEQGEENFRQNVMKKALSYLDAPYLWGGKTPMGVDCSGLCSQAYLSCGAIIYRDAMLKEGFPLVAVSRQTAKPGDLIFFPGHVAMLLPEGRFLHSTTAEGGDGVRIESLLPGTAGYRQELVARITGFASLWE